MNYLHWIFIAVYVLLAAGTMITILMDNRQPAKAIAWILVLMFLPVAGIVLYFFFGQNTRKEKHISQQSLDQLAERSMLEFAEQKDLQLPATHRTLIQQFINQNWALPFKDNGVDMYTNGHDFFLALLKAIGRAKSHIHLTTYIIADDALGRLISDALIDRARQGIEVRLIYDDVGCWRVKSDFFERMRREGIEVRAFLPVHFAAFTSKINYRNHRKLCVIDGREGFIGGMNIAMRYTVWRDTHLHVTGSVVYALQHAFLVDWYFIDRTLISGKKYYPADIEHRDIRAHAVAVRMPSPCLAQVVTSSPISEWPTIMQGYVRILLEARSYVYIETPYFLPTEPILNAMRTAALAGVDVRLMVPMKADSRLVEWASRSYLMEVVESGVKIFFYTAKFNHTKLLVSDDTLSTCGSTNVDFRSFENNFEANIFFYDRDVAMRMKQIFLDDLQHCTPADEVNGTEHRPFYLRLWESLMRLLAPLL